MASSSLFAAARRLLSLGRRRRLLPVQPSRAVVSSSRSNSAQEETLPSRPPSLWSTLSPLGKPGTLLVPEIELWAAQPGNLLRAVDLQKIIRLLRTHRRHRQALEVSEWMNLKGHVKFLPMNHAIHLDLIGHIHGVGAAETYFSNLSDKDKTAKPYGALLNCYARERLVDKAMAHFQKMKELGFVFTVLPYNNLMSLYTSIGQHERVPLVMVEMKSNGIVPDKFSYNLCINAYGTRADFIGLENTLEEMECEPQGVADWNVYALVANHYIKGDLREKAYSALQKAETKMDKKDSGAYSHLISLYGHLGDKSEVNRLWALQLLNCNKRCINKDYSNMLAVLVKLDEIAEAEDLLKKWESSKNAFDFRVPNFLLKGYCQKGLLDKAEALLEGFLIKGKKPTATSWAIVASGYAEKGDVARAYELAKNALRMCAPNSGWIPSPLIQMILKYLGDEGEVKDVEAFIDLLKVAVPVNSGMTEALSRAQAREEKKAKEAMEAPDDDIIA